MSQQSGMTIFWFRRDLRLHDNIGLHQALLENQTVQPIFIFDRNILDELEDADDKRVEFIHNAVSALKADLEKLGSSLRVFCSTPEKVFVTLAAEGIESVYTNRDYEPYARERDQMIAELLGERGVAFRTFKDHVIFEPEEVLKDDGEPYSVFTPYMKKWKGHYTAAHGQSVDSTSLYGHLNGCDPYDMPSLDLMGFEATSPDFPAAEPDLDVIRNYHQTRNIPSIRGTSRLSVHLRFGTISIRELTRIALETNEAYLNELIWRNFYQAIIWHFPHVVERAFKSAYDHIPWRHSDEEFAKWCNGQTGYPIVDAGMRELKTTGFMHNRVRMITASFLARHLLLDWRLGEAWFARYLIDFELASNNGGWQWAAGTGCDAAPYFRIFNPTSQTKRFDPEHKYIKKWVPEYQELNYPAPIVDHKYARERALATYKSALDAAKA